MFNRRSIANCLVFPLSCLFSGVYLYRYTCVLGTHVFLHLGHAIKNPEIMMLKLNQISVFVSSPFLQHSPFVWARVLIYDHVTNAYTILSMFIIL